MAVTVAGEDREAGILGEARIGEGKVAENEAGFAVRFDAASVNTVSAEAGGNAVILPAFFLIHESSISQEAALKDAAESQILAWPGRQTKETVIEVESP